MQQFFFNLREEDKLLRLGASVQSSIDRGCGLLKAVLNYDVPITGHMACTKQTWDRMSVVWSHWM